jgi:hypothetical protein
VSIIEGKVLKNLKCQIPMREMTPIEQKSGSTFPELVVPDEPHSSFEMIGHRILQHKNKS